MAEKVWNTIREALPIAGKTVIEVTCDEQGDPCCEHCPGFSHIYLHFDDFSTLTLHCRAGDNGSEVGFHYDGHPGEDEI